MVQGPLGGTAGHPSLAGEVAIGKGHPEPAILGTIARIAYGMAQDFENDLRYRFGLKGEDHVELSGEHDPVAVRGVREAMRFNLGQRQRQFELPFDGMLVDTGAGFAYTRTRHVDIPLT